MINIAKKKLPFPALVALVYISYCAMSWYSMRGTLAYYGEQYALGAWLANDVWAFFLGGLVPTLIFELVSTMLLKKLAMKLGPQNDVASIRYGVSLAVIAANVMLFALKFIYIAAPLYANLLNIILDPTVTLIFVGLYLWYAFKQNYVDKTLYRVIVTQVMTVFLGIYGLLAVVNIMIAVA